MIVFVCNFIPMFFINYLIWYEVKRLRSVILYTILQLFILYLMNYNYG
jgi:hypothetical protein